MPRVGGKALGGEFLTPATRGLETDRGRTGRAGDDEVEEEKDERKRARKVPAVPGEVLAPEVRRELSRGGCD